jgi:DNA topoisomerase VI subunit A
MTKKNPTVKKLEDLGSHIVKEIDRGEGPTFETVLRTKSNTLYDEGIGCLRTGSKTETRKFLSVAQARTFMQTVAIASKTRKFLLEDLHTSIRGLFYQLKFSLGENLDEDLFSEQSESNNLIEDLEAALRIKREDLNLTTDRKGFVAGPMVIKDSFGGEETTIDCTKQGRSGWAIPSDVDNDMEISEVDADYVLVVEKDALWQRLNEDKFWKKENCLVITPKGQSTRGTRRLLRKLADKKLKIYCFSIDGSEPLIHVDENGLIRNDKIEDYCQSQFDKFGSIETPLYEKTTSDGKSMEVDEDGEQTVGDILNVVRHPITEPLYEVKTKSGFSVKVTSSHSVMVFEDYKIIPKKTSELKEGDLLVVPTNVPNNERLKEVDFITLAEREAPELLKKIENVEQGMFYNELSAKERKKLDKNCVIRWGKSNLYFNNKIKITEEFARLLGYFVSEGSVTKDVQLTFGSKEKRYIKDAKECIKKTFGCHIGSHSPHPSSVQLKFGGNLLAAAFEKLFKCGKGAKNKAVPFIIFNAPRKIKFEFLRAYLRGDGCARITKKGGRLWGITISRKLASDLVLLLMQLDCWATIELKKAGAKAMGKYTTQDIYHIFISNKKSLRKLKSIALDIREEHKEQIAQYIDRDEVEKSPVYCSVPTSLVKPIQETIYRFSGQGISDLFSQKTISLEKLEKLLATLKKEPALKREIVIETLKENPWSSTAELTKLTGFEFITVFKTLKRAEKKGRVKGKLKKGDRVWLATDKETNKDSIRKINVLSNLAKNKIALIPVRHVKKVKASSKYVYDVEVNPTHTFVGGVGPILLHNTDCDAWGWYIYWTIKTGSMNLAYLGRDFAVPEAKFLGVTMQDIKDYDFLQKLTIKAKDVDIKRAEEMMSYPWINRHKEWVKELKEVLKTKKKIEQDALQGQKLTFVGEYIKEKIENKRWLP